MFKMKQNFRKPPKIYSVLISEQLLFDVYVIFILFYYKDIKI